MTLDQRARSASKGLRTAVSGHPLLTMNPEPAGPGLMVRLVSFAGAFVIVAFVGFLMIQTNMFAADEDASVTSTPSTVVPTTVPPPTSTTAAARDDLPIVPADDAGETKATPPPPDVTPPELVITSPADGERFEATSVEFTGLTEPGTAVMAGPYAATVAEDGTWSIVLILSKGGNRASFTATDQAGNVSEASIVVYYEPPATPTTKPSVWAFTAHATYGECELDPPYDEYYGTAAPGTTILVLSEYGSGSTVANEKGEWWVRVEFPGAPYGKTFAVKVKNETTYEKVTFEFVSLAK